MGNFRSERQIPCATLCTENAFSVPITLLLFPGAAFERSWRARTSRTTSTENYLVVLDSCALLLCSLPFLRQIMHLDSHRITADWSRTAASNPHEIAKTANTSGLSP